MIKKTTQIPAVKINFMSEEIYDSITPSSDELYAVEVTDNLSIPLLTPMWMDHIANDICWLRADTFSWQSGDVYKGVYNLLKDEWDHGTPTSAGITNPAWYQSTFPVNGVWYAGASPTKIVAVMYAATGASGSSSNIGAISYDGINWTQFTMPATAGWSSVAYGNDTFVVISNSATVAYSLDEGVTWQTSSMPSSASWQSVVFADGKFVAIAYDSNKSAYSSDGITWTETTLPRSTYWWSLCYGNGKYVATGVAGSSAIAYSSDGITWTSATAPAGNANVSTVVYGSDKFVAYAYRNNYGYIWTSADGVTWTEHASTFGWPFACMAYHNGTYVLSGYAALDGPASAIAESEDGLNWTIVESGIGMAAASCIYGLRRFLFTPYTLGGSTGDSITYYYSTRSLIDVMLTPKGFQIVPSNQAEEVSLLYNNTGVAWYYILDTENKLFKLPRTKFGFTGLRTGPGNYVEPGLPNITGNFYAAGDYIVNTGNFTGAFKAGSDASRNDCGSASVHTYPSLDFDASYSNSIYGNSNTVQPPATQMYLYFYVGGTGLTQAGLPNQAGHAGEILVTDGERADWKPNYSRNIGETIFSLLPQTDACLHLLDGALLDGNGSYAAFATYIQGLSIDYPDCFTTEENWQQSVTTYGVCGKFVYDATNNTVRLPKVTGIVEGTLTVTALGDLVEAGLPDHDHSVSAYGHYDGGNSSLFYEETGSNLVTLQSTLASVSNAIYGNSTTVQPQTIKGYYYIVVASSVKPDYVVDVDQVMIDLAAKADTTLFSTNGLYVTTYVNGTEWYREYFSDANKTQRVWLEQGGDVTLVNGYATITFLRGFSNTQYNCTATRNSGTTVESTYKAADIVAIDSYTTLGCRMLGSTNDDSVLNNVHASWVARGI